VRLLAPRSTLTAVAAALTLAAAGCGSDDAGPEGAAASPAPAAGAMFADALSALEGQRSAVVSLGVDFRGRASDPQLAPFLGNPISAKLSGGFSRQAISITGAVQALGRNERIEARADRTRSFVQFGGTWYGPGDGLDTAQSSSPADSAELRRAVALLREHGDDVIAGEVTAGPDIDGPTWQVSGPLDANGILAAARAEGEPLDADDQQAVRVLAPLVRATFAAGREDKLPRRMGVRLDLSRDQVARLRALAGEQAEDFPLEEMRAGITVDMSRWGAPVRIEAPADPQPFEALQGALGGALLGAGG